MRATLKGWEWALENTEKAGPLAVKYDPTLDPEIQIQVLNVAFPLIFTGEDQVGWMNAEIWEEMYAVLFEQGVISNPIDPSKAYDPRFLEEIYP